MKFLRLITRREYSILDVATLSMTAAFIREGWFYSAAICFAVYVFIGSALTVIVKRKTGLDP